MCPGLCLSMRAASSAGKCDNALDWRRWVCFAVMFLLVALVCLLCDCEACSRSSLASTTLSQGPMGLHHVLSAVHGRWLAGCWSPHTHRVYSFRLTKLALLALAVELVTCYEEIDLYGRFCCASLTQL